MCSDALAIPIALAFSRLAENLFSSLLRHKYEITWKRKKKKKLECYKSECQSVLTRGGEIRLHCGNVRSYGEKNTEERGEKRQRNHGENLCYRYNDLSILI